MENMIACCGITCTTCPAYIATRADDDAGRTAVAEDWSRRFGMSLTPADINCDGCHGDGRTIGHCTVCAIRLCCLEKKIDNCARCDAYPCATLIKFTVNVPFAKAALEKIRHGSA